MGFICIDCIDHDTDQPLRRWKSAPAVGRFDEVEAGSHVSSASLDFGDSLSSSSSSSIVDLPPVDVEDFCSAVAHDSQFAVSVRWINGDSRTLTLQSTMTISELRSLLLEELSAFNTVRLFKGTVELQHGTLEAVDLQDGSE